MMRKYILLALLPLCLWACSEDEIKPYHGEQYLYFNHLKDGEEEETEAVDAAEEVRFANLDEALEDVEACVQEIAEVTRKDDIKKAPAKKPAFSKKRR